MSPSPDFESGASTSSATPAKKAYYKNTFSKKPVYFLGCIHWLKLIISSAMKKSDFNYLLPDALIAQKPLAERDASRLLCMNRDAGQIADRQFTSFIDLIRMNTPTGIKRKKNTWNTVAFMEIRSKH